jgi:hypothetical protein
MGMPPRLSKSKYMAGLQCPKRLYLEIHHPELATDTDAATQAVFDMGARVGALARETVPGGVLVDVDYHEVREGLERTAALLADRTVPAIFEGFVEFDGIVVRPDLLERVAADRWRLTEVKSTGQVKPEHHDDLAIQAYVLTGAGCRLDACRLMHIDTGYLYPGGPLDLSQFFSAEDVTADVLARQADIPKRLREMREVLAAATAPAIEPDDHCTHPYDCAFWDHCAAGKSPRWIYHLPGGRRAYRELVALGVQTIDEIPAGFPLSPLQQKAKDGIECIGPGLGAALKTVQYPVHHLDFETVGSAIPLYPSTRPYQAVPFQWSNHVEASDGSVRHEEYLHADGGDPREPFARTLLASLGHEGSICVYTSYEQNVLTALAEALPDLRADLLALVPRLWDLHAVVKAHYYHPGFGGSYSIKAVLPAVIPALAYDDLEIQDGTTASLQYAQVVFGDVDMEAQARLRAALLKYCERDTLAMVEVRRALHQKSKAFRPGATSYTDPARSSRE